MNRIYFAARGYPISTRPNDAPRSEGCLLDPFVRELEHPHLMAGFAKQPYRVSPRSQREYGGVLDEVVDYHRYFKAEEFPRYAVDDIVRPDPVFSAKLKIRYLKTVFPQLPGLA